MTSFSSRRLKAFKYFASQVRAGHEGAFFSCDDPIVGKKWAFGFGKKTLTKNWEAQTQFSVFDFEGTKSFHFIFEHYYDSESEISFTNDFENLEVSLKPKEKESLHFLTQVKKAQEAQTEGLAWVLNLCESFHFEANNLSSSELLTQVFCNFLNLGKSHCGGVLSTKEQKYCSLSPEVFLRSEKQVIEAFPIKGTGSLEYLKSSNKEISELRMITDLLRNDLGQIAKKITVENERFFREEAGFYHAFAHIKAELEEDLNQESYQKLLPAGSVSGAPKNRVISLIKSLESFERGFFTGTFGAHFKNKGSIFNILIRTLFAEVKGGYVFPVGAGITIESDLEAEWQELLKKIKIIDQCASKTAKL